MTSRTAAPKSPRDLPRRRPRMDKERERQAAVIADAGETEDNSRDLVHGEGGTIDRPTTPGELSRDD
ncbi:hypothetical protein XH88_29320 [Bradyrhizobium sp. CCBAU 51627]|nr:hypothetical protein [Bradyrhizobium sp. CCBAU 51627]